jgi:hypothetical protein
MTDSIMPAFDRYPVEAAIIGRLLAGYGELEYDLADCLGAVIDDQNTAFRAMFRTRSEEYRIWTADALLRPAFQRLELTNFWERTRRALSKCKEIRNQYAHCHWHEDKGLHFTHIEKAAKTQAGMLMLDFWPVDAKLLKRQEEFFRYTERCLTYLRAEHQKLTAKIENHPWPAPEEIQPPPLHSPKARRLAQMPGPLHGMLR